MILIEMINNKRYYCLGDKNEFVYKLYVDKKDLDFDYDFIEIYPCTIKRKYLFGRKIINKILYAEHINKRHILNIKGIGTDEQWLDCEEESN